MIDMFEIAMKKLPLRKRAFGRLVDKSRRFLRSEEGPTAVEYAVMLSLIVVVCLTAIRSVGTKANTTFSNVASSLAGTAS